MMIPFLRWRTRRKWQAGLTWQHNLERRLAHQGHAGKNIRGWVRAAIWHKRYMALTPDEIEMAKQWLPLLRRKP